MNYKYYNQIDSFLTDGDGSSIESLIDVNGESFDFFNEMLKDHANRFALIEMILKYVPANEVIDFLIEFNKYKNQTILEPYKNKEKIILNNGSFPFDGNIVVAKSIEVDDLDLFVNKINEGFIFYCQYLKINSSKKLKIEINEKQFPYLKYLSFNSNSELVLNKSLERLFLFDSNSIKINCDIVREIIVDFHFFDQIKFQFENDNRIYSIIPLIEVEDIDEYETIVLKNINEVVVLFKNLDFFDSKYVKKKLKDNSRNHLLNIFPSVKKILISTTDQFDYSHTVNLIRFYNDELDIIQINENFYYHWS